MLIHGQLTKKKNAVSEMIQPIVGKPELRYMYYARCVHHAKMTRDDGLMSSKIYCIVGAVFLHNRFPLLLWEIITQILGKNGSLKSPSAIMHGCAKLPAMIIAPLCPFGHSNHA